MCQFPHARSSRGLESRLLVCWVHIFLHPAGFPNCLQISSQCAAPVGSGTQHCKAQPLACALYAPSSWMHTIDEITDELNWYMTYNVHQTALRLALMQLRSSTNDNTYDLISVLQKWPNLMLQKCRNTVHSLAGIDLMRDKDLFHACWFCHNLDQPVCHRYLVAFAKEMPMAVLETLAVSSCGHCDSIPFSAELVEMVAGVWEAR